MAHIKLILLARENKDRTRTIQLYVKMDGQKNALRLSTGERVREKDWDQERMQIRGRTEDVKKRNILLRRKMSLANEILADYALMNVRLTNERFQHEYNNPSTRADFLHFYRTKCQQNYDRGIIGLGTYEAEARTGRKLDTWKGKILFSDINRRLLEDFDAWHSEQLKKKGVDGNREREKALKHIRKYLNAAKSDDSFPYKFSWPFDGFVWPRYKNRPEFLTEEEVRTLLHFYRNPEAIHKAMLEDARRRDLFEWNIDQFASEYGVKRIQRTLKWFLFQCFTGLRYSDLERVTWQHIEADHLVFVLIKTINWITVRCGEIRTTIFRRSTSKGSPKNFKFGNA